MEDREKNFKKQEDAIEALMTAEANYLKSFAKKGNRLLNE